MHAHINEVVIRLFGVRCNCSLRVTPTNWLCRHYKSSSPATFLHTKVLSILQHLNLKSLRHFSLLNRIDQV